MIDPKSTSKLTVICLDRDTQLLLQADILGYLYACVIMLTLTCTQRTCNCVCYLASYNCT